MAVITRQEEQPNGKWWTWVNYEGYNTFIHVSDTQITEEQAVTLKNNYVDAHLYDKDLTIRINIMEFSEDIRNAVLFIRTENPNLTTWNNYLAGRPWDAAYAIRFFLSVLARELASRNELTLSSYTETQVLSALKTWIINAPLRRLEKIIFG